MKTIVLNLESTHIKNTASLSYDKYAIMEHLLSLGYREITVNIFGALKCSLYVEDDIIYLLEAADSAEAEIQSKHEVFLDDGGLEILCNHNSSSAVITVKHSKHLDSRFSNNISLSMPSSEYIISWKHLRHQIHKAYQETR